MVPRVRTQLLARLVERRARAAAIAQHGLNKIAELPAVADRQDVVAHVLADVGDDKGDAVHNREFPKARFISAMQRPFEDMLALLAGHVGDAQGEASVASSAADRTDRT